MSKGPPATATNPTIFLRLNSADPAPREIAWEEFSARYAPIITAFGRALGGKPPMLDDVVQDVMLGFFLRSPTFVYDPSKGRFRGYLMACTDRALRRRLGREARLNGTPLDEMDPGALAIEQVWNDVWERELLHRAVDAVRISVGHTKAFQAFELYVVLDEPAADVAKKLAMHLNSVYRAKEQITRLIRDKLVAMRSEDE